MLVPIYLPVLSPIAYLLHVGRDVLVVAHVDGHPLGGGVGAHLLQLRHGGRARLLEEDVRRARLDHLRWSSAAQCGAVRRRRRAAGVVGGGGEGGEAVSGGGGGGGGAAPDGDDGGRYLLEQPRVVGRASGDQGEGGALPAGGGAEGELRL